ncbi:MAG: hypothetical protein IKD58_17275 [Loktanella sp.]|nr:hypothetical protein [Loktanella sp.]
MQRLSDKLVFIAVGLWIIAHMRREWLRLVYRQLKYGLVRVRVAVPRLANEKFLWRKTFDHDPRFAVVTDKLAAKDWVAAHGFDVPMPKTLWTGTDANDIPEDLWQRPIYIKATHGCQMNIPVLTPPADREKVIAQANSFMAREHGARQRQWAYGQVPRALIAEEAIRPDKELMEVKYYTYGDKVEQFVLRRAGPPVTAARWLRQDEGLFSRSDIPTSISPIIDLTPLPDVARHGVKLASDIGQHFDHIRVDTLIDDDVIYLGELTVYNMAGRVALNGDKVDDVFNRSWDLRRSWFLTTPQRGWRGIYAAALRRALDRRAMRV